MDPQRPAPDTQASRAALEVAQKYLSPALLNHSLRSWLWALGFANGDTAVDDELLYVASLLHDVGLVETFDSHRTDFEAAGGAVAAVFAAGAGWDRARREHLDAAIVAHMSPDPMPAGGIEGHLLDLATGLDITGTRPDELPKQYMAAVLQRYPRLDIATDFALRIQDQASRKPDSAAARVVREGVVEGLVANPLETITGLGTTGGVSQ